MKLFKMVMTGFFLATLAGYVFAAEEVAKTLLQSSDPSVDVNSFGQKDNNNAGLFKEIKEDNSVNEWMNDVSVLSGILLTGLDAPTGSHAQANSHPVLIRVKDEAVLPKRIRDNVKGCFIVGAGYGDVRSKRAYIRAKTLSCILKNEKVMEVKVKGIVVGEDGEDGVRGKLVSKQKGILDQALMAGNTSGVVGQAFQQSSTTLSTSPHKTTTIDTKANQSEETFPIIEIDAGRQIDVKFKSPR